MFNLQVGAKLVEFVLAGGSALAQTEQAVFAIVRKYGEDAERAGPF
jgi:hypothetical protein